MKRESYPRKKVLLVDADRDTEKTIGRVTSRYGLRLLVVTTSGEAFKILKDRMARFELVIVDVDPGAHGLALLEAISACADRPPLLVISSLEETYMLPIARKHGAAGCLGKPVDARKVSEALERLYKHSRTCNRWGSLVPAESSKLDETKEAFRGISQKLHPFIPGCD